MLKEAKTPPVHEKNCTFHIYNVIKCIVNERIYIDFASFLLWSSCPCARARLTVKPAQETLLCLFFSQPGERCDVRTFERSVCACLSVCVCACQLSDSSFCMCSHSSAGYGSTVASDSVSAEHFLIWPLLSPVFALLLSCLFSRCLHLSPSPVPLFILSARIAFAVSPLFLIFIFCFAVSFCTVVSDTHKAHKGTLPASPLASVPHACSSCLFFFSWDQCEQWSFHFFFCSLKWCHKVVERKDGDGRDDLEKHRWRGGDFREIETDGQRADRDT